jgi:pimeloyl-ACP methyl ester carboxylesterase
MTEPIERSLDHDAGRLHVSDHPGRAPAIVAMHRFPDDSHIYDRLIRKLAPYRVVTSDWIGYGRPSRRESAEFTADDGQREIAAVLDGLELDQVVLVGHDAFGPEAVDFALTHPDRIALLVLLNTYVLRTKPEPPATRNDCTDGRFGV